MEIVEDTGERYRHETLIEAVRPDGSRWALTGSPDLSGRALLTPAGKGGNIEVGVVSRPAASLFPERDQAAPAGGGPGGAAAGPRGPCRPTALSCWPPPGRETASR